MDAGQAAAMLFDIAKDSKLFRGVCMGRGAIVAGMDAPGTLLADNFKSARMAMRGLLADLYEALGSPADVHQGDFIDSNPEIFEGNGSGRRSGQIIGVATAGDLRRQEERPLETLADAEKQVAEQSPAPQPEGPKVYPEPNADGVYIPEQYDMLFAHEVGGRPGKPHAAVKIEGIEVGLDEWVYGLYVRISPNATLSHAPAKKNGVFPSADLALKDALEKARIEFRNSANDPTASNARQKACTTIAQWCDEELAIVNDRLEQLEQDEEPVYSPVCRVCGCTDEDCSQCVEKTGKPCHWVEEDLCSACSAEPVELAPPADDEPAEPSEPEQAGETETEPAGEPEAAEGIRAMTSRVYVNTQGQFEWHGQTYHCSLEGQSVRVDEDGEGNLTATVKGQQYPCTLVATAAEPEEAEVGQEESATDADSDNVSDDAVTFDFVEPGIKDGETFYEFDLPGAGAEFEHPAGLVVTAFDNPDSLTFSAEVYAYLDGVEKGKDEIEEPLEKEFATAEEALIQGLLTLNDFFSDYSAFNTPDAFMRHASTMRRWIAAQIAGLRDRLEARAATPAESKPARGRKKAGV